MNYRDTVELESPAPPSHAPPPTPPASELRDSSDSESEHVSDRIVKMQEQQARIAMLEEEVRSNDLEIGHLKEQIGNANTEQCQAVLDDDQGKIARLRRQVEGLGRLLKEALGRERKLESELSDMRRHLREARSTMNDIPNDNEARETREERARQQRQIEDVLRAQSALGDDFRSFAQRDAQEPNAVKDAPAKISRRRRRQSRLIIIASRGTKKPWTPV